MSSRSIRRSTWTQASRSRGSRSGKRKAAASQPTGNCPGTAHPEGPPGGLGTIGVDVVMVTECDFHTALGPSAPGEAAHQRQAEHQVWPVLRCDQPVKIAVWPAIRADMSVTAQRIALEPRPPWHSKQAAQDDSARYPAEDVERAKNGSTRLGLAPEPDAEAGSTTSRTSCSKPLFQKTFVSIALVRLESLHPGLASIEQS